MSLGNTTYNPNEKLFILKLKTQDEDKKPVPPYFAVSEKIDDKWVTQDTKITNFSGVLAKIESKEKEYNGDVIKSVAVFFKDGDETYLLDLRYNIIGRSLLNALLNVTDVSQPVKISLYKNAKGYGAASVRVGEDLVNWKFSLDEQPKPAKVKFKGKEISDFTAVDDFFDEAVKEFAANLGKPKVETRIVKVGKKKETKAVVETEVEDDPLF